MYFVKQENTMLLREVMFSINKKIQKKNAIV